MSAASPPFAKDSVISRDGARIGYASIGHGPGVALIQGSMGTIDNFSELARELSGTCTVYLPERRGRGISPKAFTEDHSVETDVADIAALLDHVEVPYVFGLSSGGLIALQAAADLPGIEKVAVYEPPLFVDAVPVRAFERFSKQMAAGHTADALVTAVKASRMGPPALGYMPNWILAALVGRLLKRETKNAATGSDRFWHDVALSLQFDFAIIDETSRTWRSYRNVEMPTLLLGGAKSPRYLTRALDALEHLLPRPERVELSELDHGAAWNYHPRQNRRGNPRRVARELRRFFLNLEIP